MTFILDYVKTGGWSNCILRIPIKKMNDGLDKQELCRLDDEKLWQVLKGGRKEALELLFYKYHSDLYRYAIRFCGSEQTAKDQLQALFLKLWDRREYLSDVVSVKTYLWTALRRSIISYQKNRRREEKIFIEKSDDYPVICFSAEEIMIQKEGKEEKLQLLYKAINRLNPRQREILYLKYFEGMSYDEIEQITSLNYQTIRNYVYESIKSLKIILKEEKPKGAFSEVGLLLSIISMFGFI